MSDELTITAITPCFISGADGTFIRQDLLRPPSLKGCLRWWFRVVARPYLTIEGLRTMENILFGSTKNRCPFKIQIIPLGTNNRTMIRSAGSLDGFLNKHRARLSYLWAPLFMGDSRNRKYIDVGNKFKIKLFFNRNYILKENEGYFNLIRILWYHCLWLLSNLAGLRLKSRRGAGSFKVDINSMKSKSVENMPNFNHDSQENIRVFYEQEPERVGHAFRDPF